MEVVEAAEPVVTASGKKLVLPILLPAEASVSTKLDRPCVVSSEDDTSCIDFSKEMIGKQLISMRHCWQW